MSCNIDDILKITKTYLNKNDNELIIKAFNEAKKIHSGEMRHSGDEYICHPITTAYYLAKENLDAPAIAASLLHDVIENSPVSIKYIKDKFGAETAMLVDGVTKLNKVRIKQNWNFTEKIINHITGRQKKIFEQHVDNLRKMFLAMTKDVRVILIKLADRLHNMQTLKFLPKQKQKIIAQETLEIYAPIAYRLGMGELKGKLEDLAFPYIYPNEYKKIKKLSNSIFPKKENYIDKFNEILRKKLKETNIKANVHGRKKHLYSLWQKINKYHGDINKIYDLVAIRIIVDSTEDCYKVLGLIHNNYKPLVGRIKDYIAVYKPNGYRSLHTTVFGPEGEIVEIQIRTWQMHEQAEMGIAAHWHYSTIKSDAEKDKNIKYKNPQTVWLKELARWHDKIQDPEEWTSGLKMDFFKDQIFVFTPKGDVINLPADSTPIDFAYSIHSEIGNKCSGAKVNEKMVKIDSILKNGDIVEVLINKNSTPKKDWLKFVKSAKAKNHIKAFFSNN